MKKLIIAIVILFLLIVEAFQFYKLMDIKMEVKDLKAHNYEEGYLEYDLGSAPDGNGIDAILKVPRDIVYVETCCMYVTTFASFKDVDILEKEVKEIMDTNYKKNNDGYYLDDNSIRNITYRVEKGDLVNYIHYNYTN